jgi:ankyrin repeat protein
LLDAKARLCRRDARPALLSAIQGGFGNAVQVLLDAKAAVNQGPIHPLKYAYEQGRADVVQLLLDAKADVNFATEPASDDDEDTDQSDGEW